MKARTVLTAGLLALSASAFAESKTSVVLVHGAFGRWQQLEQGHYPAAKTAYRGDCRPAAAHVA